MRGEVCSICSVNTAESLNLRTTPDTAIALFHGVGSVPAVCEPDCALRVEFVPSSDAKGKKNRPSDDGRVTRVRLCGERFVQFVP